MGIMCSVYIWAWVMFCWLPYAASRRAAFDRRGI